MLPFSVVRSPALLELSGIGDKEILEPLGIATKIHNPAVGENLQEHLISGFTWREFVTVVVNYALF